MIIPGQLPPIVASARSPALQALALRPGQVISATVIGPAPNGGTRVQIAGQVLNMVLPQVAVAGQALRFEVQGSGAQLRLALQPAPGSAGTPAMPAPSTAAPSGPPTSSAALAPAAAVVTAPAGTIPATTSAVAATLAAAASPQAPATGVLPGQATVAPPLTGSPAVPYATAPPAAAVVTSPAAAPVTTAAQPVPTSPVAPNPASASTIPTSALPGATLPPMTAGMPSTPQVALAQMVQSALPQQNSIVALTTALTNIAGSVALPEPVARAARQVMANQLTIAAGKLDGPALQRAVLNSGIFHEAALARAEVPALAPPADMKGALLDLRQALTTWLMPQMAAIAAMAQIAPPLRGKFPRATGTEIPPIDPATPADEVGKHLFERTEAALSRIRLHQHASLPDPNVKGAEWSMDLPVVIAGHQTLLQLQIHRDEQNPGEAVTERGWQMRFAINLPDLGEVGAQVSLHGSNTGIMLWASQPATTVALEGEIEALRSMIAGAGLTPGALIVRHGAPLASRQAMSSGHLVDAMT